jgi:membrane protein
MDPPLGTEFRSPTEPDFEPPPRPARRREWVARGRLSRLVQRVWRRIGNEPLPLLAGGVALFGIFSLMPAIAATVSIYGLLSSPTDIRAQVEPLASLIPPEVVAVVADQLSRAAAASRPALGLTFAVSVALALLGATSGIRALMTALNAIHRHSERRRFLPRLGLALLLGIGGIATVVLTVSLVVVMPTAFHLVHLEANTATILSLLRWPALLLLVMAALAVLYRVAPTRPSRRILPGVLLATVLWTLGSVLLSTYVDRVANYSVYGAFGGVMIVLLWFFVSSFVILFGAVLNDELDRADWDWRRGASRPPLLVPMTPADRPSPHSHGPH